jgi:hypothetical protein
VLWILACCLGCLLLLERQRAPRIHSSCYQVVTLKYNLEHETVCRKDQEVTTKIKLTTKVKISCKTCKRGPLGCAREQLQLSQLNKEVKHECCSTARMNRAPSRLQTAVSPGADLVFSAASITDSPAYIVFQKLQWLHKQRLWVGSQTPRGICKWVQPNDSHTCVQVIHTLV